MLVTLESADKIILESGYDFEKNFVAIAMSTDKKGEPSHCGLFIKHNNKSFLFHFDFDDKVKIEGVESLKHVYYLNLLPLIKDDAIEPFLAKCELICENEPDLEFGYAYNGEFFNDEGKIVFKVPANNISNCVFFCISVISGYIVSDKYIEYQDWTADTSAKTWYHCDYLRSHKVDKFKKEELEEFWNSVLRIPAGDYFSSAPITDLAIRKVTIEEYSKLFIEVVKNRHKSKVKE